MGNYVNKIVELFTKSKLSDSAKAEFHNWLVDPNLEDSKNESLFHLWNEPNDIGLEETLDSLYSLKANHQQTLFTKKRKTLVLWRYAAAIAVLVCLTVAYVSTNIPPTEITFSEHYSPLGEVKIIELPDGSIVQANSETVLMYPEETFGKKTRTIYVVGQANFKVKRNEKIPFIVKSKEFSVTALGTEFEVSAYPDDSYFKATLISGSIKVDDSELNTNRVLNVSEQFVHNKITSEQQVKTVNLDDVTAWQHGEMVFRGATIREIVKIIERQYDITFHYKGNRMDEDRYNFKFRKESSIVDIMEIIKGVSDDLDYKIEGKNCYIY